MKKLLLLTLFLSAFTAFSQNTRFITVDISTMVATDTAINIAFYNIEPWSIQVNPENLAGVEDGFISIGVSPDGVNFDKLDDTSIPYTLVTGDTQSWASATFPYKFVQLFVSKQGLTGGTVTFKLNR